jgi:RNA polymerase sporulation-specific sigma factor
MAARTATALKPAQKVQRELEDLQLVLKARNGSQQALDDLMRRYTGFVRLKASSYFLAGGDGDDLIQEGMIGLYKAVRDFRPDKETSFRSFAELCVTRQIITAIKTATRFKHSPLNTYVSFSHTPAGQESDGDCTLGDALPGPSVNDPSVCVISTEELQSLVFCLGSGLSSLESQALTLYLEGNSTRRRSTTPSSASSGRSSRIRRRAKCWPEPLDVFRTPRLIAGGRLRGPVGNSGLLGTR